MSLNRKTVLKIHNEKPLFETGGTRGISAAVSRVLSAAGWYVIAISNSQAEISAFDEPAEIDLRLHDVTNVGSVHAMFATLTKRGDSESHANEVLA